MTRPQLLALCKVAAAPKRHRHLEPDRARRAAMRTLPTNTREVLLADSWLTIIPAGADRPEGVRLTESGWGAVQAARALRVDPFTRRHRKGDR